MKTTVPGRFVSRRQLLKTTIFTAMGAMVSTPVLALGKSFRIGFVSPASGPLAIFAESDEFVMSQVRTLTEQGLLVGGQRYPVEILYRDSESNPDVATRVTQKLILQDEVDLILTSSTPETTVPVSAVCEKFNVPCISNDTPWQSYFYGRGGKPDKGFDWTFHFCWGLEDVIASYSSLWDTLKTNRKIGALWPDDEDGRVWADEKIGFPPVLREKGFEIVDPGRFNPVTQDYAAVVRQFMEQGVEIVTGVLPPPFFQAFWKEALKQKFKPRIVTVGKASEFPAALMPFRSDAHGMSVEVWWCPTFPYRSGMTSQSARQLADDYMQTTGRNWTMPLGFKHALFEVALDVLKRSAGPRDRRSIRDAIRTLDYQSIVGPVNFQTGPVPNISKTPLAAGQWDYRFRNLELLIVDNVGAPEVPKQAHLRPMM